MYIGAHRGSGLLEQCCENYFQAHKFASGTSSGGNLKELSDELSLSLRIASC